METLIKPKSPKATSIDDSYSINTAIKKSWSKIAPFWPLKNLIAVNPIAGFEDLPFEEALRQAKAYFQQKDMPLGMQHVNRESIKWLQVFFDEGQSTIQMPQKHLGFLKSILMLVRCDEQLHKKDKFKQKWLEKLPQKPEALIKEALLYLKIPLQEQVQFLTLMLTTLSGWAAHIQYRTKWADDQDAEHPHPITQAEYLAFRLVLVCLIWPEAKELIIWHKKALQQSNVSSVCNEVSREELDYQINLMKRLNDEKKPTQNTNTKAQLVFCIDVRSEPFRRALEARGNYQTYGFAGFFGVPVTINNTVTGEAHASCPVLLKPAHKIDEYPDGCYDSYEESYQKLQGIRKLYQSMKYTFTVPFSLVETVGLISGLCMGIKSISSSASAMISTLLKRAVIPNYPMRSDIHSIPLEKQVTYGLGALRMIGLIDDFAPLVVFCGHGSATENNAYATALDCGACGGRHGAPNARILTAILNSQNVRNALRQYDIVIPQDTLFLAAEHNTTTDQVEIYGENTFGSHAPKITTLKHDLEVARNQNSLWRSHEMGIATDIKKAAKVTALRAKDWSQVRPEWGLARNAAFIIGPRALTQNINLEGRSFLHSYEWEKDSGGEALTTILTAPMVVAQWINAQYFFSSLDNVAFGSGSKITKNITGKIGIMQGNASDLMHGLPLQSVYQSDKKKYHNPQRLTVVVYAPTSHINPILKQHYILQKLFGNGWVHLICYNPKTQEKLILKRDFTWKKLY